MLLWELLSKPLMQIANQSDDNQRSAPLSRRLPYETRCSTITKSGKRCRGKIRRGSELMNAGLRIKLLSKYSSNLVYVEEGKVR